MRKKEILSLFAFLLFATFLKGQSTDSSIYEFGNGTIINNGHSADYPVSEINAAEIAESGKIDVWDFGAEQLDTAIYQNNLSVDIINSWYDESVTVGSSGNVLPSFTAGVLSWVGGDNDRLRSTNTSLTRYDENIASITGYTGRVYVNSAANISRFMSMTLSEDDELTIISKTDAGGNINFEFVDDPAAQTDEVIMTSDLKELNFVAKQAGTYHIFDDQGKPSYFRIYRKDASYLTLSGTVDVTEAPGIPVGYTVLFENEAGKTWQSAMNGDDYSVRIPVGYSYQLSLYDANGYIISIGKSLEVTEETSNHNITVLKVELYTVSGAISGLGSEIANLELVFTPDPAANKIYMPEPLIDTGVEGYSVQLESGCEYAISASGVNDYSLANASISIGQADETVDIAFTAKPLYQVSIEAADLSAEQLAKLGLTFCNLQEEGYDYFFNSVDDILLRDGVYSVNFSGLDEYPLQLGLTSNLKVEGADVTKMLDFRPISLWSFDDKEIDNGSIAYSGLLFTGSIYNEVAKGHLAGKPGATIQVPVSVGARIRITYYYSADFSIEGGTAFTTSSGSTSILEYAEYIYPGSEDGYVNITIGSGAGTTYIREIALGQVVEYAPLIYVGQDKEYRAINDALDAIAKMVRDNGERVTVMIDPGNYEEMLVIDLENVSLKNAALDPSIKLLNEGVDIDANAVRITSYYGHGYSYYSMGSNQKWNADVLRVNKDNGYLFYENMGAGTTNGSYWNATLVIAAKGFEADHIIFENSFNQYISQKESEDVVVMWESGSKGERPVSIGNSDVQNKSYVERAAAIAITNKTDKVVLNKCRIVGRQDSFYGGAGSRVVVYKGAIMGAVDYIFGGMTAVFYKSELVMNTSGDSNDRSYLTAAQQSSGRGFLMYECRITSAVPDLETASNTLSKPGYFGRPWQANTSEVVFYKTSIDTSGYPGSVGQSLITPVGWLSTLGGESSKMYEYGSIEYSGEDNTANRASWSTVLTEATLTDGTDITTFNFTKGNDNWDPIPELISNDLENRVPQTFKESSVRVYACRDRIFVSNVQSNIQVNVYSVNGTLVKSVTANGDFDFNTDNGFWIVRIFASDGSKSVSVVTHKIL